MIIDITGRHVSVSDTLKDHAREKLEHVLRHHDKVVSAHVILDVEKTRHVAEMIVFGRNLSATVHAESDDLYTSIDRCAEKLRHHLEHHHGRRRDKRRRGEDIAENEAAAIAQGLALGLPAIPPSAGAAIEEEDEEARPAGPRVVVTTSQAVKPMSVEDAALEFEDERRECLVFRDASTERVHVLYRRADGTLGLVETGVA